MLSVIFTFLLMKSIMLSVLYFLINKQYYVNCIFFDVQYGILLLLINEYFCYMNPPPSCKSVVLCYLYPPPSCSCVIIYYIICILLHLINVQYYICSFLLIMFICMLLLLINVQFLLYVSSFLLMCNIVLFVSSSFSLMFTIISSSFL